jgi:hypothetical protein
MQWRNKQNRPESKNGNGHNANSRIRPGVMAVQLDSSSREDKPYQAGKQQNQAGIEKLEGSDLPFKPISEEQQTN